MKDEERGGSGTRKRKDGMRKEDSRRKKEAPREEGHCQDRKFPWGALGTAPFPFEGGRRAQGFGALLDPFKLILLEKTKQPPTWGRTPKLLPGPPKTSGKVLFTHFYSPPQIPKSQNILRFWGGNPGFPV